MAFVIKLVDNFISKKAKIGENVKIWHFAYVGDNTEIGNNVTIGGKAGFAGHIKVGDNVVIAALSGVTKNIKDNSIVAGFPAIDIKEWKKNLIRQRNNGH